MKYLGMLAAQIVFNATTTLTGWNRFIICCLIGFAYLGLRGERHD